MYMMLRVASLAREHCFGTEVRRVGASVEWRIKGVFGADVDPASTKWRVPWQTRPQGNHAQDPSWRRKSRARACRERLHVVRSKIDALVPATLPIKTMLMVLLSLRVWSAKRRCKFEPWAEPWILRTPSHRWEAESYFCTSQLGRLWSWVLGLFSMSQAYSWKRLAELKKGEYLALSRLVRECQASKDSEHSRSSRVRWNLERVLNLDLRTPCSSCA